MSRENLINAAAAIEVLKERKKYNRFFYEMFVPNTPLSIEHYKKHYEYFASTKNYKFLAFCGGNRVGKTTGATLYEVVCHITGLYPDWWPGIKFDRDLNIIVYGFSRQSIRETTQKILVGELSNYGTGLIPKSYFKEKPFNVVNGFSTGIDKIYVRHLKGHSCTIEFRTYEGGWETLQGLKADMIVFDEEPKFEIFQEAFMRLVTTNGHLRFAFSPLHGPTKLVRFIEEKSSLMKLITCSMYDAPHITQAMIDETFEMIEPYLRDARINGIPQLGEGQVYPFPMSYLDVPYRDIPDFWPQGYSMDVGFNNTAILFFAQDPTSKMIYITNEYHGEKKSPQENFFCIKDRGVDWMNGVVDPAAANGTQVDGSQLMKMYQSHGMKLTKANNAVNTGIAKTYEMFKNQKLKKFPNLISFEKELGYYQRKKGEIVKENDHFCDALRYAVMNEFKFLKSLKQHLSEIESEKENQYNNRQYNRGSWAG